MEKKGDYWMPRVRVIKVAQDSSPATSENELMSGHVETPVVSESVNNIATNDNTYEPQKTHQSVSKRKFYFTSAVFLLVLLLLVGLLFKKDVPEASQVSGASTSTDNQATETEATRLHREVSKIVDVPEGQTPSLVTVTDASKLVTKSPVLFKYAKNGDLVLFYVNPDKTGKAILYRPETKKIIAVIDGNSENMPEKSNSTQ